MRDYTIWNPNGSLGPNRPEGGTEHIGNNALSAHPLAQAKALKAEGRHANSTTRC